MVLVTHVPAAAASATLTFLYFSKLQSGEVLATFLCLALAHRARLFGGQVPNGSGGILGRDEIEHGNTRREGVDIHNLTFSLPPRKTPRRDY